MPEAPIVILAGALCILLLVAAWGDIRTRTIPNWLTGGIAVSAPLWWWATGLPLWPAAAIQLGVALGAFALFAIAWRIGAMGGGDLKLIAALALWFAPLLLLRMLVVMALAGGALTILMLVLHRVRGAAGRPEIPYGVAIAFAGLWVMANDILTVLDQ